MTGISPLLAQHIKDCSMSSITGVNCAPMNNFVQTAPQMPTAPSPSVQQNDSFNSSEAVQHEEKPKKRNGFLIFAGIVATAGMICYAAKRGKVVNRASDLADDFLSNVRSGLKTFTKKGRSVYQDCLKNKTRNLTSALQDVPSSGQARALNPQVTEKVEQTTPVSITSVQGKAARKASDTVESYIPQKTEQLAAEIVDPVERARRNRTQVIRACLGEEDIGFYKDRPMTLYSTIHQKLYSQIRTDGANYTLREGCDRDIASVTQRASDKIRVLHENGWHFRKPAHHVSAPTVDRISLNVYPEDGLIEKLDDFIARQDGLVSYKTPECLSDWTTRHDPITMYFKRPVTREIEEEIVKIASPHIRHTDKEVLIGRKIADSIYEVPEPNEAMVKALIERAKRLNFDEGLISFLENPDRYFGAQLYDTASNGTRYVHSSAGYYEAAKRLVEMLEAGCPQVAA